MDAKTIQRYKSRNVSWLIKRAQKEFNKYIRNRDGEDGYFKCISCNETKSRTQMNAGHYLSAGHHQAMRFDERNVNGQCIRCNKYLGGNLIGYAKGLRKKYGPKAPEELEDQWDNLQSTRFKWDRFHLIRLIEHYKAMNK